MAIENISEKSFMKTYKSITELAINLNDTKNYLNKYYNIDTKFLSNFDKELRQIEKQLLKIDLDLFV